jgi:hypothetical protein
MGGIAWPRLGGYKTEATRACPAAPGPYQALTGPYGCLQPPVMGLLLLPDDGGNAGRVDAVEVKMQPRRVVAVRFGG